MAPEDPTSAMLALSNAVVQLHKAQFGRGPTRARCFFAGPDAVMCVLEDVLLPAEIRLVALGDGARVRDTRVALQAATSDDFITAVEELLGRKVRSFASAIDADNNVVFENFVLRPT